MPKKTQELDQLPCFEITIENDDNSGIRMVSLVSDPAIEVKGMFFSKEEQKNFEFKAFKDQMKIVGPAMIPHKKIFRRDGEYEYFVTFSPMTIRMLVEKFNRENNNRSINVDHSSQMVNGYIEQNWIVEDPIYDKSKMYGFNLQPGTWFIEIKIEDEKFWNEEVKELGKYSFSIEGLLGMKPEYMSEENFAETYNDYPQKATENAKIALRWAEKNGWGSCGTAVGKKRANQLANRESLTRDTIARMAAFERHRQNSQKALGDGCGRLMWLCWGGDEGIAWAQRKLEQIDNQKYSIVDELTSVELMNILDEITKTRVSFDFDGVLSTPKGQAMAQREIKNGNTVLIVTKRNQFKQSAEVLHIADMLGIPRQNVHFTNGVWKWKKIDQLMVDIHYDNQQEEIDRINKYTNVLGKLI